MGNEDLGFMVGTPEENPISAELLNNWNKNLPQFLANPDSDASAAYSQIGYTVAGVAELERKVVWLEKLVRELLAK